MIRGDPGYLVIFSAKTGGTTNIELLLAHHLWHWDNIKSTLVPDPIFAGFVLYQLTCEYNFARNKYEENDFGFHHSINEARK